MKAIAVVSFRQREPRKSVQKTLRQTGTLAAPARIRDVTSTWPFWTWFIENPRAFKKIDKRV
jgi:hypothetical protein